MSAFITMKNVNEERSHQLLSSYRTSDHLLFSSKIFDNLNETRLLKISGFLFTISFFV